MQYSRRNFWLLAGLGIALVLVAFQVPYVGRGQGLWSVSAIGFGGLMMLGVGLAGVSYGAMDDIQKHNMKSDWYWGSAIGMALLYGLVFPYVLFGSNIENLAGFGGVPGLNEHETSKRYFFSGVMVTMGLFGLGYFAVYLFRRLREMK